MYIGIDNGITGAVCALSDLGQIVDLAPVGLCSGPISLSGQTTLEADSNARKAPLRPRIDANWLAWWIKDVTQDKPCPIAVEDCPEHSQSKSSMRSMGISYGQIIGAIAAKLPDYPLYVVRSGNPRDSWQKALGVYEGGRTKENALALALELWPDETWIMTPKARKPHGGCVDAALIAHHLKQCLTA